MRGLNILKADARRHSCSLAPYSTSAPLVLGPTRKSHRRHRIFGSFAELYLCGAVPSCTWLKCTIVATYRTILALSAARWLGTRVLG